MIYYVSGPVTVLEPGLAVVECGGVGYGCRITAFTAAQLKLNQPARLYITESIREDAFDLYGFISKEEQRCYELLTSVNGVGPKAAMAILSSGGPQNFTLAVMTGAEKMLTAAQGVGVVFQVWGDESQQSNFSIELGQFYMVDNVELREVVPAK